MSKNALVSFKGTKNINTEIQLTGSKSECNRALIISALSKKLVKVENLSNAADTVTLNGILNNLEEELEVEIQESKTVDVGPAGTAMRFLSAYLSAKNGNFLLTGTERMKQRPIGILAEALKTIGADISYAEAEGFPPLNIVGPLNQKTAEVKIKGDISSQYISALLMIAPILPQGLTLEIEGELTSKPYVDMTLDMLAEVGIAHSWNGNSISIKPQAFKPGNLVVEPDWSAASYWYSIAALADEAEISLPALKEKSLQGDSQIKNIMKIFGIATSKTDNGIAISNLGLTLDTKEVLDLKTCPDLAQTIVVIAAALGKNMAFTGLETLKIKETDRIAALQNELAKIGVTFTEDNLVYTLNTDNLHFPDKVTFATYEDHRMAMAFAPLALLINEVEIEEMQVVEKSYPYYWEDLKKAGFDVNIK
ncbi:MULTISPECIES: 3-phosphoshikimate 1-carboxyvinyltransferase [unclassified Pedobacter]|uniref:3-phosphoshikimate 1-carboxyvinyltransferase n=1 Tax=unclassified Pedobacter TaxID=2628915 RepID=UPI0014200354|nr:MULTISPECIES: 3-phosphoshikimate 1-carboxyvinyltransferase [unclassified Pedobacter]NII83514.1 3-phosphoshikimate 1-carboxyvinyltransferase [Pedobacter sp. SG908]NMN37378.1 3-phosphoshikimate 1-carboxyvinyltransferase [Pedobacter sp. SG918]